MLLEPTPSHPRSMTILNAQIICDKLPIDGLEIKLLENEVEEASLVVHLEGLGTAEGSHAG